MFRPLCRFASFVPRGAGARLSLTVVCLPALVLVVAIGGCGGGGDGADDVILARVGDTPITRSYYEKHLALTKEAELPLAEDRNPVDTTQLAGKEAFLQKLVDDLVMVRTATALGYGADPEIVRSRQALTAYEAGMALWNEEINQPSNFVSEEQLQAYYDQMGTVRRARFVITDLGKNADAARQEALDGAPWEDIVARYHTGQEDPTGRYEMEIAFGRMKVEFEDAVYGVEIGDVTEPVLTSYGYWVLKVDAEKPGKKPPLDVAKADILDHVRRRNIRRLQKEIRNRVRERYEFRIDDEALLKAYDGLPPTVPDQQHVAGDQLPPLDISTVDMEMPFYRYRTPDGPERVYTLGDFKVKFDRMGGFQRPKREGFVAGVRALISGEVEKALFSFEAESSGYVENEEVAFRVEHKVDQLLIDKLYAETVDYKRRVTPAELDTFWAEHKDEFSVPETRSGRLVVCLNEEIAAEARNAASEGVAWEAIVGRFGSDPANRERQGRLVLVRTDATGPVRDVLYALQEGGLSPVFALDGGGYGVVRLDAIVPAQAPDLTLSAEAAGKRIREEREQVAFKRLLAEWKRDFTIEMHLENLGAVASWPEIHETEIPDNVVPRYIPRPE